MLSAVAALAQSPARAIKIGVLTDMSSIYSDLDGPGAVEAAKMAIEDFGPVLGEPVELVIADHQNKPDVGAEIARQWYDEGVDAIVGVGSSSVALAVQEISRDKRKLVLFSSSLSSDITGSKCSPYSAQWTVDTWSLAHATGGSVVRAGGDTWFFVTADYASGHAVQRDTAAVVEANGGKVLGSVNVPFDAPDFSSFLLLAQASKAKIIGLANAGDDAINSIKEGAELGIATGGQRFAALVLFITDVRSLGLTAAQGIQFTTAFYWDQNDEARAWSKRFFNRVGHMPTSLQAGAYSATLHYFKAVTQANSEDPDKVMAEARKLPINDVMTKNGKLRIDGRVERELYLYEVKRPEESRYPWDYLKLVQTIPAAMATRPLGEGGCPLVKSAKAQ
jgi:branched-chain amino acid transport system substrate-binding protein